MESSAHANFKINLKCLSSCIRCWCFAHDIRIFTGIDPTGYLGREILSQYFFKLKLLWTIILLNCTKNMQSWTVFKIFSKIWLVQLYICYISIYLQQVQLDSWTLSCLTFNTAVIVNCKCFVSHAFFCHSSCLLSHWSLAEWLKLPNKYFVEHHNVAFYFLIYPWHYILGIWVTHYKHVLGAFIAIIGYAWLMKWWWKFWTISVEWRKH